MSLNGDFYDRQLAQLRDLRNYMLEARDIPGSQSVVGNADRGSVGLMVGKLEGALLGNCCLDEWDGSKRKARLWLMSELCNRPIRSAYSMKRYEVTGWLRWAIIWSDSHKPRTEEFTRNYPGLKVSAYLAMKTMVEDREFRMLAMALPRMGRM